MRSISAAFVLIVFALPVLAQRQVEVVADVGLTNQVNGISQRTLYTPNQTGMFRVTVYLQCTKGDPQGMGMNPVVLWTDDNGEETFIPGGPVEDKTPGPGVTFSFVIKDLAGIPIQWELVKDDNRAVYEIYLAVERIGSTER